ncbi:MAG: hypothetical protein ACKVS7_02565 [Gemmatimonadaceae bacterium]
MPSKQLFIIRTALMAGVGAFAAIVTFQRSQGMNAGFAAPEVLGNLRYVLWALAAFSVAAALFLRGRVDAAADRQKGMMLIVGWAFGEGVALLGTVQHFMGAPLSTMAVGMVAFIAVLMILPIPRARS